MTDVAKITKEWTVTADDMIEIEDSEPQLPYCHYGGGHVMDLGTRIGVARTRQGEILGCVQHLEELIEAQRAAIKPAAVTHEHDLAEVPAVDGYKCMDCDAVFLAENYDVFTLRQCKNPQCEQTFVDTDHSRSCPECNRPFSAKLADVACEDCGESGENGCVAVGVKVCPVCALKVESELPAEPVPTKGKCQYCGKVKRKDLRGHIERNHYWEEKKRKEEALSGGAK